MTETNHLKLKKPSQEDFYNVNDFNLNADLLDAKIEDIDTQLENKANISALGKPNGIATLNGNGKLVQMPTAEDVAAIPLSQKGIANGIATLNSSGKLAQMPTAADVGAIPLTNEGTWTPEVIEMLNSTGGCTYTSRSGHYIRIGKLTLVTFDIVVAKKPTDNNNWNNYVQVCIKGMPGPLARQDQAYSMGAQVVLKTGDAPIAASTRLAYNTIAFVIPSGSLSTDKLGNGFELHGSVAYTRT